MKSENERLYKLLLKGKAVKINSKKEANGLQIYSLYRKTPARIWGIKDPLTGAIVEYRVKLKEVVNA